MNDTGKINYRNYVDYMVAWKNGELDGKGTVELFQYLIDKGFHYKLEGIYKRKAQYLINAGLCKN